MTILDSKEWANAIESAEQVMLRWGHGQVRRVPDELVEKIVAALRAPVSERGTPVAWRTTSGAIFTDKRRVTEFDTPLFERNSGS